MADKCGNYAEVVGEIDGPGVFCFRAKGHSGLCNGRAEGYEHSTGRRMEASFEVRWVARHKAKVQSQEGKATT